MQTLSSPPRTRNWYNRLSGFYDTLASAPERPARLQGLKLLNPQSGESILEVGFGTGHALVALAHAVGSAGKVAGLELSDGMKELAQKRIEKESVAPHVALVQGDARNLPFSEKNFDAVFMSFTLELFADEEIPRVLAEIRRVLKPGGRLAVVALAKIPQPTLSTRLYERLHRWFPHALDCHPIDVKRELLHSGFEIRTHEPFSLWGLSGAAVIARRPD